MSSSQLGLLYLFLFAVSQGVRDAYFGSIFQSISFLFVAVLAFGLSCVVFVGLSLARNPGDLTVLVRAPRAFLALNITTAVAWLCFLYGLRHLEPAVVATLYNGIGPIVALAAASAGWGMVKTKASLAERGCYLGLAATLAALAVVVLTDRSGLSLTGVATQAGALGLVALGGAAVTVSYIITRWFTDAGAGSNAVMGTRFLLTLAAAAVLEVILEGGASRPPLDAVPFLAAAAFALIVIPAFFVQLGVSRTSALAANIFRALGPVFVFAVQQLDGRLRFSGATLVCIIAFCAFTVGASLLRGWSELRTDPI
jgi:hypothetical protein